MTTFSELQQRLAEARFRKTVLMHLVEYIDTNFRSVAGTPAKNVLVTDEKVAVPSETFEVIVTDLLLGEAQALEQDIQAILGTTFVAPIQGSQVPFVPPQQAPFVPPGEPEQ